MLGDEDVAHSLGPDLELVDCRLELACDPAGLVVAGVLMERGSFVATRRATDFQFYNARFVGTAFEGTFHGCDFGAPAELDVQPTGVVRCDFSRATLHLCAFMQSEVESCVFAPWPTVVVLDPCANARELERLALPRRWGPVIEVLTTGPSDCNAVVIDVRTLIAEFGGDEKELRRRLAALPFVKIA